MSEADAGGGRKLLSVDVERRDGVVVVHVAGELDYPAKAMFLAVLEELMLDADPFVVDLVPVTFIDSSGLGTLSLVNKEVRRLRGPLAVVCPPGGAVSHLMELTGLDAVLRVYDTVDEAVAAARADLAD